MLDPTTGKMTRNHIHAEQKLWPSIKHVVDNLEPNPQDNEDQREAFHIYFLSTLTFDSTRLTDPETNAMTLPHEPSCTEDIIAFTFYLMNHQLATTYNFVMKVGFARWYAPKKTDFCSNLDTFKRCAKSDDQSLGNIDYQKLTRMLEFTKFDCKLGDPIPNAPVDGELCENLRAFEDKLDAHSC